MKKVFNNNRKRLFLYLGIWTVGLTLIPGIANAINVTVPLAPGSNFVLISTTTGQYVYTSTSSLNITGKPVGVNGDIQINEGMVFSVIPGARLDNTGNARGVDALDLQSKRTLSTQVASGISSTALGQLNTASGYCSTALGYDNAATVDFGIAIGSSNSAYSSNASAVGVGNTASGVNSVAFGNANVASLDNTVAVGIGNTASCYGSLSFGYGNVSSGSNALTVGTSNTVSDRSTAVGIGNSLTGSGYDQAFGFCNQVPSGCRSSVGGYANVSICDNSVVWGVTNVACNYYATAYGNNNTVSGYGATSLGSTNTASNDNAVAVGYSNMASGGYSTAVGWTTIAAGHASSAFGYNSRACSDFSTASGYSATASGYASTAIGPNSLSSGSRSVTLGVGSCATCGCSISVGYLTIASGIGSSVFGSCITDAIPSSTQIGPNNAAKVTILSTGNVGIGTTTPAKTLTVAGTENLTGALFDSLNSAGANGYLLQSTGSAIKWISSTSTPTTGIATSSDLTGITGATTIATYAVPAGANHQFRVGAYINVTAVTLDVAQVQVAYTDENSTSVTATFFPQGLTSANIASTGDFSLPPQDIRVKGGTTITLKTILTTGTGSITYDVGGSIQLLN